jgi:hypothetical protein
MKFHFFHDWTKWKPVVLETWVSELDNQVPDYCHKRVCTECGKIEWRKL